VLELVENVHLNTMRGHKGCAQTRLAGAVRAGTIMDLRGVDGDSCAVLCDALAVLQVVRAPVCAAQNHAASKPRMLAIRAMR
jgi:hypothetical protein